MEMSPTGDGGATTDPELNGNIPRKEKDAAIAENLKDGGTPLDAKPEDGIKNDLVPPAMQEADGTVSDGILKSERRVDPTTPQPPQLATSIHMDAEDKIVQQSKSPYELDFDSKWAPLKATDEIRTENNVIGQVSGSYQRDTLFPGGRRFHNFDPTIGDAGHYNGAVNDQVNDEDPVTHSGGRQ
eukprot:TRINITY_DN767_c0_g3_i2.p1 TRINITY_DN767_c0_g3~~TRINITY_DN767_c0_g3_i2.p1  ORF type:complete len:184 (-),score=68.66 TRINITY_DN767_c0_g3_i2:28-579(-)